ncbi:MAG TPA: condensation domain-containing protein, partial [Ktedonobacterales bacterium]|nr:condensation domain-containing protein [Ktedonobacterales bacterium]
SDGWSKGVLMRELTTLYQAFANGAATIEGLLPDLPIQYADFAVWQREWLQGPVLDEQLAYWKRQLADIPVLQLPTDHPRPVIQTVQGGATARRISHNLAKRLVDLSRQEKCSLFMVMLAAFDVLLSRYSGQDDIAVGTAIANRNRAEIENLIGFFVNSLVLRTDLTGNPSFRELIGRVRDICLGAYAHQDLPFEHLVEVLQPKRDLSSNPLFQVMLSMQNAPAVDSVASGLTMTPQVIDIQTSKFDLTLFVFGDERGLYLDAEYRSDLFEEATIFRMLAHLEVILDAVAANPDQPIAMIPLLTGPERHQLLHEWNAVKAAYPQQQCIHELFERHAAVTPDVVALASDGEQISYGELNRRANQLAHYLRRAGVGPDVCVGISFERSLDLITGILGVLKAGGAYVPMDPTYPRERLSFILDDTRAPVLLTQQSLLAQLPTQSRSHVSLRVVCL